MLYAQGSFIDRTLRPAANQTWLLELMLEHGGGATLGERRSSKTAADMAFEHNNSALGARLRSLEPSYEDAPDRCSTCGERVSPRPPIMSLGDAVGRGEERNPMIRGFYTVCPPQAPISPVFPLDVLSLFSPTRSTNV